MCVAGEYPEHAWAMAVLEWCADYAGLEGVAVLSLTSMSTMEVIFVC